MGMKMKNLTLHNLAEACRGRLFNAEHALCELEVEEIVTDSRKVVKNSLFIAIRGERVDGHDFIDGCYEAGAICVISEKNYRPGNRIFRWSARCRQLRILRNFI